LIGNVSSGGEGERYIKDTVKAGSCFFASKMNEDFAPDYRSKFKVLINFFFD